jgi:hypothetical protein
MPIADPPKNWRSNPKSAIKIPPLPVKEGI